MMPTLNNDEIKHGYFMLLCSIINVNIDSVEERSYWILCKYLFNREFYWSVHNDDNRLMDAVKLREEYIDTFEEPVVLIHPISVLEVLIGIAYRMTDLMNEVDQANSTADVVGWFWHIIRNLDLWQFDDAEYSLPGSKTRVTIIIDRLLSRTYDRDGHGGLFPLTSPKKDQRKVEIWYQMSGYLLENYYKDFS